MSKTTKIWLVAAAFLVVIGLIIFGAAMTAYHWDFNKLSTEKFETNTYIISEDFSNISMKTDTADILFAPSDDGSCKVVCFEQEKAKHSAAVTGGTLEIKVINERKWYDYFGITIGTPKITVYLPGTEYDELFIKNSTGNIEIPKGFEFGSTDISSDTGDVKFYADASKAIKIDTSTGDVKAQEISAGAMDISTDTGGVSLSFAEIGSKINIETGTGEIKLSNVTCESLAAESDTGDILLTCVVADDSFSVESDTGDVKFDGSDAAEIFVKTDTGDVKGSLLSDKVFVVETDTGRVDVPKTINGGRCEITTDTGNIKITVN